MKILNKLQFIALYLLGFLIIGAASVITGKIGFGSFKDIMFYVKNLLKYLSIILIVVATVMAMIDNFKETNPEYKMCNDKISSFVSETYVPSLFNNFLNYCNPKRKANQHIYNVKKKLHKLEVRTERKEKIFNRSMKRTSYFDRPKYVKLKARYDYQLSDEYIANELPKKFVKYDRLSIGVILSGFYSTVELENPNDFVTKNKTARILKDKVPSMLVSFAFSSMISSLLINFRFDASAFLDILGSVLTLIYNTFVTIKYAENYCNEVTLNDIRFRKGTIVDYERWLIREANKATPTTVLGEGEHIITQ